MRISIVMALLLTACATAPVPPPSPSTPPVPPPPPGRPPLAAKVHGRVVDARGIAASGAQITVRPADESCRPFGETMAGAVADANGQYLAHLEAGVGPDRRGCVIVEALAGGAKGRITVPVTFRSTTEEQVERVQADVTLDPPVPLTRVEADGLMDALRRAINGADESAIAMLASYAPHGHDALRVALDNYRASIGQVRALGLMRTHNAGRYFEFQYELLGSKRATPVVVIDDVTQRITSPLLEYSYRGGRFVATLIRLVASNEAERLAAVLTADDIDYPVDKARALIERLRPRLDFQQARARFVNIDEASSTIRYEVTDGTNAIHLDLGYGDGLLWLRER